MARLAKKTQTAFDELDWPCIASEIEDRFLPNARVALGQIPEPCFNSISRVVAAAADSYSDGKIPAGQGAAYVRHFRKRSEQLAPILKVPIERRYALIELASLASIAGRWPSSPRPRVTLASYKECVDEVARLEDATIIEREQWRAVFWFQPRSPCFTPAVLRNLACALVWCGYLLPEKAVATDEYLAQEVFRLNRETFVRARQEALRVSSMILEFSNRPPAGGPS